MKTIEILSIKHILYEYDEFIKKKRKNKQKIKRKCLQNTNIQGKKQKIYNMKIIKKNKIYSK